MEKRNFTEKTIKKLKLDNGLITTDQKLILESVRKFYAELFDDNKNSVDFQNDLHDLLKGEK